MLETLKIGYAIGIRCKGDGLGYRSIEGELVYTKTLSEGGRHGVQHYAREVGIVR